MCVESTQNKQARCLLEREQVPVPLEIINGQKQTAPAFGEVRYEQNHRRDKKRKIGKSS